MADAQRSLFKSMYAVRGGCIFARGDAQQASTLYRTDFQKSGVSGGSWGKEAGDQGLVVVGRDVSIGVRVGVGTFVEPCESGLPDCNEGVGVGTRVPALGGEGVGVGEVH